MARERAQRILLAESDEVSARVAQAILERLGYTVDVATTGPEVVERFAGTSYHIVLMDSLMPQMNGFEATARIRQLPGGREVPIIGTTAQWCRAECVKAGMDDLASKPFERTRLESTLQRWIQHDRTPADE